MYRLMIKITRDIYKNVDGVKLKSYPLGSWFGFGKEQQEKPRTFTNKGLQNPARQLAYDLLTEKATKNLDEARLIYYIYCGDAEVSKDVHTLTAAYDTLMQLSGFRDLEYRRDGGNSEPYHLDNSSYADYAKMKDMRLQCKAEMFRRMRIFAYNYTGWSHKDHREYWLMHCDDGVTLEEIGQIYKDGTTGLPKKVSKCWISMLFKRYRGIMDKLYLENPSIITEDPIVYTEEDAKIKSFAYMD